MRIELQFYAFLCKILKNMIVVLCIDLLLYKNNIEILFDMPNCNFIYLLHMLYLDKRLLKNFS